MADQQPSDGRPSRAELAAWLREKAEPSWRAAAAEVAALSQRQKAAQEAAWLEEAARLLEEGANG